MTNLSFPLYSEGPRERDAPIQVCIADRITDFRENIMDYETSAGGYEVPVDPMDLLQCDSCQ